MKVKFTEPEEFCEELERDKQDIDRGIVRCTIRYEPTKISPSIRHVIAIASYPVKGQIVKLERHCGEIWGLRPEEDQKAVDRAREHLKRVEETCRRLNLEVRAGSLEE